MNQSVETTFVIATPSALEFGVIYHRVGATCKKAVLVLPREICIVVIAFVGWHA